MLSPIDTEVEISAAYSFGPTAIELTPLYVLLGINISPVTTLIISSE